MYTITAQGFEIGGSHATFSSILNLCPWSNGNIGSPRRYKPVLDLYHPYEYGLALPQLASGEKSDSPFHMATRHRKVSLVTIEPPLNSRTINIGIHIYRTQHFRGKRYVRDAASSTQVYRRQQRLRAQILAGVYKAVRPISTCS